MSPSMPLTFAVLSHPLIAQPGARVPPTPTGASAVKSPQGLLHSFHFEVLHLLHGERTTIYLLCQV